MLGREAGPGDVDEAAAVVLGRVLMNVDEFFTRE
jgi:hypothetical protein